ncbi:hypothetical protein EB796_010255 [Bugula neritina]|uniref:protein-tyrosine-phosphatase n=1 Tax=Bugula neritina TaxID=10212 RepID=A0A7J7JYF0_BUGNE|nr:hypothetical protein EB796_010255 [Bugula neritina]
MLTHTLVDTYTTPNSPDTVNILSYTHSSIYINWTSVSSEGVGVIEGYRISVQASQTALIDISADDHLEYNITGLEPYINYTVSVQAKTSAGYGAPRDIHQITKQYLFCIVYSESISYLLVPTKPRLINNPSAGIDTSGSIKLPYIDISWEEPIPPNGVITRYLIQWAEVLNPPSSGAKTKEVDSTARSYRITSGLSHNKKYTVSIQARTEYLQNSPEGWGEAANRTVSTLQSTPTAVPKVSDEVKEKLSVEEQISQISFYLPSDLTTMFSLDSGNIIKYQILVIGQVSNQQFREDKLSNAVPGIASWAEAKKGDFKEPYAISAPEKSPSDWPTNSNRKKRAVASSTQIIVGTDSSCKDGDTRLCNGPLKSNQQYCVYVRGFTSAGYSDSDCIVEAKTKLNYTPIIVGVAVAVALLVVLALLVYIFRRQQQTKKEKKDLADQLRTSTELTEIHEELESNEETSSRISREFQEIDEKCANYSCDVGSLPENKMKNRTLYILPFDHSRVKLTSNKGEGDYINANFIPGKASTQTYIATQGPLPGTIDHFWRMIWEQNVTMIVMLTQLIERGRKQCEQYWPETVEKPATYGDLVVTKRAESVLPEYTIRIFDIQMGKTIRTINTFCQHSGQLWMSIKTTGFARVCAGSEKSNVRWKLFSYPCTLQVTLYVLYLYTADDSTLLDSSLYMVYTTFDSAGVGRTGTYIAVDRLLQCIQDHDEIDIFNLVMEIREYRCRMVQTEWKSTHI